MPPDLSCPPVQALSNQRRINRRWHVEERSIPSTCQRLWAKLRSTPPPAWHVVYTYGRLAEARETHELMHQFHAAPAGFVAEGTEYRIRRTDSQT